MGQLPYEVSFKSDISSFVYASFDTCEKRLTNSSYVQAKEGLTQTQVDEAYTEFYKDQPFVRFLTDDSPHPAAVVNNFCDVTCKVDQGLEQSAFGAIDGN